MTEVAAEARGGLPAWAAVTPKRIGILGIGLAAFAFVGSVSPGPNNAVLWASGIRFGFGRTVPYVIGTALGIGALVVAVAAGLDVLLRAVPGIQTALKVVGSAYLLYIAYLVLEGGGVGPASVAAPPTTSTTTRVTASIPRKRTTGSSNPKRS